MPPGEPVNETLRSALAAKGVDRLDVAASLQVDPKTVERWLSGRLPHPRSRVALAKLVDADEDDLWPTANAALRARHFGPEIRAVYPHRWAVPREVWCRLFASADEEIDILVYSGLFLFEDTGMLQLLASRAEGGVRIRLLLGDPDCPAVAQRGRDEGIGDSMAARIHNALTLIKPLVALDSVELRLHRTILYNSIYRADDKLLANPHIYGTPAAASPVLYLHNTADTELFGYYIESCRLASTEWSI